MSKSQKSGDTADGSDHDEALEKFLERASEEMEGSGGGEVDLRRLPGEPGHRRLKVMVSEDRMEAHLEAVFPDTRLEEAAEALRREGIVQGIQEEVLKGALELADRSGRLHRDVLAAKGRPAVYRKRKEVSYPFLEELRDLKTGETLHLASAPFREVEGVMDSPNIEMVRGYGHPVAAAISGEVLMLVRGEEEIEPGVDVFGKEIREVVEDEQSMMKAGERVDEDESGTLMSLSFGYISVRRSRLSTLSPIWISQDRMEAYFVNPPQIGERKCPSPEAILKLLEEQGVCFGIDRKVIDEMCRDLQRGNLRESCVRVAAGKRPNLNKGEVGFTFEPVPPARFEAVVDAFRALSLEDVLACSTEVQAVHAGQVLAEQAEGGGGPEPGKDLFGETVAPPETTRDRNVFKAGVNVRREVGEGHVRFISEIYGYAGVLKDQIRVASPIWLSRDRMAAHFVALSQPESDKRPTELEIEALLDRAQVRHGVDRDAIAELCTVDAEEETQEARSVLLARGMAPEPGQDGVVELLYKQMPDPGKLLEGGRMDFRERDTVPQVSVGQLLARRAFPTPGNPGMDVRGREVPPPKTSRGLLYAGANVVAEEKTGDGGKEQLFYATGGGWPRVVKDTLAVMQRFRQNGDVDYQVGNIKMEGDVEIEGTVKSRFTVEATGDVLIDGAVERGARVVAGGNLVVQRGIIGARVKAGGNLYALFIQDSEVTVGGDLLVRKYCQNSEVQVQGKATIQGDQGGQRQLCLLGGTLLAAQEIDAASIGSSYGRDTRAVVGVDPEVEARLEKYSKGLSFCDIRMQRAMRTLESQIGPLDRKGAVVGAIQNARPGQREFMRTQLKEISGNQKLKVSLEHHLEDLRIQRVAAAARAQIRVSETAFQRTNLQIGRVYQALDENIQGGVFQLDEERERIVYRGPG